MKNEINKTHYCAGNYYRNGDRPCHKHGETYTPDGCFCIGKRCDCYHLKWPTPEQYKAEYGEEWPDDAAVYYRRKQKRIKPSSWIAGHYAYPWSHAPDREDLQIVCACTPWGKPPDDFVPEKVGGVRR